MKKIKKESVVHFRCRIGADILEMMEKKNDLPLPNKYRLTKVMEEYSKKDKNFIKYILDAKYKLIPDKNYWLTHLSNVIDILIQERNKPFDYYIPKKQIKGLWKFLNKKEYIEMMNRKILDFNTRGLTFNKKLDNANEYMKYNIQLPHFNNMDLIENKSRKQLLITKK